MLILFSKIKYNIKKVDIAIVVCGIKFVPIDYDLDTIVKIYIRGAYQVL